MKKLKIIYLFILLVLNSCSEEQLATQPKPVNSEVTRTFMDMNQNYYPPDEILHKAEYFIQNKFYREAYYAIINRAVPTYQKEQNVSGIKKSNALLCKIYSTKETDNSYQSFPTNPYYNLEAAKLACKKAGIKM